MGKDLIKSQVMGVKLLQALGLDPSNAWTVRMTIDAGEMVRVEVGRFLTEDEGRHLCSVVDRYRLTDCAGLVWEDDVAT